MRRLIAFALALVVGSSVDASVKTLPILITTKFQYETYSIGNSLTLDSGTFNPMTVALAEDSGANWTSAYHVYTGNNLAAIVASPGTWTFVFPSQWNTALAGTAFDFVTVEPYLNDTIGGETAASSTLIAAAIAGPTGRAAGFYVLETWPQTTAYTDYTTYWNANVVNADGTQMTQQYQAINYVYQRLQATYGASIFVVPVGSVFNAVNVAIEAGQIPGVTNITQLYRDTTHMGCAGQFIASATAFATYFRIKPNASNATVTLYAGCGAAGLNITPTLAAQLEGIIWGVVSTDPRAIH